MMRLLASCIILLSSCGASSNTQNQSTNLSQETIDFEIIAQDYYGGKITSEFLVIKNIEALNIIYSQIGFGRSPKLQTPTIDFKKEIVLALFLGEKTSGGYSITIDNIVSDNGRVSVGYKTMTPKKGMMTTSVMTQPYCIVKMPKTVKEIVFEKVNR